MVKNSVKVFCSFTIMRGKKNCFHLHQQLEVVRMQAKSRKIKHGVPFIVSLNTAVFIA